MRILVDTNVVIDALTAREPWNADAEKIFLLSANHIVDMYITASSATDIYYLVRKHLHSAESAKQVVSKLYSLMRILDVTESDCIEALASAVADYEDAVIEKVASRNQLNYIVTRNIKDFQNGDMRAVLPEEFVRMIEQEN